MSFPRYPSYKPSGVEWLGEVPEHWDVKRGRFLFSQLSLPPEADDEIVTAFRDGQVTLRSKRRTDGFTVAILEAGYQRVRDGDLVIHGMDAFAGAIGVSDSTGKCTPEYSVLTPIKTGTSNSFYAALLRIMALRNYILVICPSVRERAPRFRFETFRDITLPFPPIAEQTAIAEFLDRETGKIDALVAEQRRLMELLKEKRQAVISHAVTQGLNPKAAMKDSGNLWLGDAPRHWDVKRVKHIKADIPNAFVDGPFGSNLKSEHFIEGGAVYVIESSFATQGKIDPDDLKTITIEHFKTIDRSETKAGDIIIAKIGAQFGKSSILPRLDKPAVVSGNSLKLTINERVCDVKFVNWHLTILKALGVMDDIVNATAQPALSLATMNNLPILVPPLAEQKAIVAHLEVELGKFDTLTAEAQRAIDLLQERRTALISAAVTGQIDVRGGRPMDLSHETGLPLLRC